jgi:hypothetical protein
MEKIDLGGNLNNKLKGSDRGKLLDLRKRPTGTIKQIQLYYWSSH